MTSLLLNKTLDLLRQTERDSWHDLARTSGATYAWIAQLHAGNIKDPSVNKIELLYNALSGKKIKL